jgi:hypothetical protein
MPALPEPFVIDAPHETLDDLNRHGRAVRAVSGILVTVRGSAAGGGHAGFPAVVHGA